TPLASYIEANMSSISRVRSASNLVTGTHAVCSTACPYVVIGRATPARLPMLHTISNCKSVAVRWAGADRGDQAQVPQALRGERAHGGPVRPAAAAGPEPAVRQRRHGAVRAVLRGAVDRALPAGGERAEVHPHPGHRRGGQDQPARHVLPDERQLLLRR